MALLALRGEPAGGVGALLLWTRPATQPGGADGSALLTVPSGTWNTRLDALTRAAS